MIRPDPAGIAGIPLLAALTACLFLLSPVSVAGEPAEDDPDSDLADGQLAELETIVVNGGLARPQMWKVSKGDHVLWVVANRAAPAGSTWRMDEVDARLAESQLLMLPGRMKLDLGVNIVHALTLLPTAFKAAKNPDGQTLKDVLPPETYARWRALKTEYVGRDNDIEKWRPSIALGMLEEKIADKIRPKPKKAPQDSAAPPRPGPMLQPLVEKAARKHRVKSRTQPRVERKIEVDHARDKLKSAGRIKLVDTQCVAYRLDYLEGLIDYWKRMAEPDAQAEAPKRSMECNESDLYIRKVRAGEMPDSAGIVALMDDVERQERLGREQLQAEWLEAAQAALEKNASTFAVLRAFRPRDNQGYMDKLRALGYTVEEPAAAALTLGMASVIGAQAASPAQPSAPRSPLFGEWILVSSERPGTPSGIGIRRKTFTETTWSVVQKDPASGAVVFEHGGDYTLNGTHYSETVKSAGPSTANLIGQTFTYQVTVTGDTCSQAGGQWTETWRRVPGGK